MDIINLNRPGLRSKSRWHRYYNSTVTPQPTTSCQPFGVRSFAVSAAILMHLQCLQVAVWFASHIYLSLSTRDYYREEYASAQTLKLLRGATVVYDSDYLSISTVRC